MPPGYHIAFQRACSLLMPLISVAGVTAATYERYLGSEHIVLENGGSAWITFIEFEGIRGMYFDQAPKNCRPADVFLKVPEPQTLAAVNMPESDRPAEDIAALRVFPNLRRLKRAHMPLLDKAVIEVGKLSGLTHLDLSYSTLDSGHCDGLQNLSRLVSLDLRRTNITDVGATRIAGLARLTELRLTSSAITDNGALALGKLTGLSVLTLGGTGLTDAMAPALKSFTKLKSLDLESPSFTGQVMQVIGELHLLEELRFVGTRLDATAMKPLARLRKLRTLNLNGSQFEAAAFAPLAGHPTLEAISLDGSGITNEALKNFPTMPCLTSISLRRTKVTRAGWAPLFDLPKLKKIDVDAAVPQAAIASHDFRLSRLDAKPLLESPDGKRGLRFPGRKGGTAPGMAYPIAEVYDKATGKQVGNKFIHPDWSDDISCHAFSPDGKYVVLGAGHHRYRGVNLGNINIWKIGSGELVYSNRGKARLGVVHKVAFSDDSRTIYYEADPFEHDGR